MLKIETFDNKSGGNAFFKAVTHPLAAAAAPDLLGRLKEGRCAVYDVEGQVDALAELYDFGGIDLAGSFVQDVAAVGRKVLGKPAQPATALTESGARIVFVAGFDAERAVAHIKHLLPAGASVVSLDALRLPESIVPTGRRYLDPLNFATNFVFFREENGLSTRLVTANYWSGYGASALKLWLLLFDAGGKTIAEWTEDVAAGATSIVIDSKRVRQRFNLPEFTGQLFVHAIGAQGHDVVKYALDTYGSGANERAFSCTHDANSWPADFYAGLPAPDAGEQVTLWLQNSQPCAIPAGAIALNLMGDDKSARLDRALAPFASHALDVASLLPAARWPQQIEVSAGKYMVRPRYEIVRADKVTGIARRRIAHVNVERTDLKPDPKLAELSNLLGKGHILPAPILPPERWRSFALPTPMARSQAELPIALLAYDASGKELARHEFGKLRRWESIAVEIDSLLSSFPRKRESSAAAVDPRFRGGDGEMKNFAEHGGHMELVYDFAHGNTADGWLHALFRYEDRASGHRAETSFGSHVFNTVLTYKGEPQSYSGKPPGLSTRLFLRLGVAPHDTLCHLIYPASTPWHATSTTDLVLTDAKGGEVGRKQIHIPCGGSRFWRYHEIFDETTRARAGENPYIVIRDTTCRLFGYHGVLENDGTGNDGAFSLDHMFGF
ncbi:MAG TPA: hypothetical protein VG328_15755 [Stellaceae bacterium]|jgi:hypothetical protein|nr:hypothetical protein [Stellaceae bacterium]